MQTLGAVCAGLALKMAVVNLLTARCRTTGLGRAVEDATDKFTGLSLFRLLLVGYGPFTDADTMERLISCARNSTENEPLFAMAAWGWAAVTTPPSYAPALLVSYLISRYVHNFIYLFVRRQPFRALAWAPGVLITVFIASQTLLAAPGIYFEAFQKSGDTFRGREL